MKHTHAIVVVPGHGRMYQSARASRSALAATAQGSKMNLSLLERQGLEGETDNSFERKGSGEAIGAV
ncbi:hypothetical protein QWA68_011696 [Fusarium oxysporum]|nr:hypothetical protein QWA68_011696 [Fusarium oxysporum]